MKNERKKKKKRRKKKEKSQIRENSFKNVWWADRHETTFNC